MSSNYDTKKINELPVLSSFSGSELSVFETTVGTKIANIDQISDYSNKYKAPGSGFIQRDVQAVLSETVRTSDYTSLQNSLDYAVFKNDGTNSILSKVDLASGEYIISNPSVAAAIVPEGIHFQGQGHSEQTLKVASRIKVTGSGDGMRFLGHVNSPDTRNWWLGRIGEMSVFGGGNGTTGYGLCFRTESGLTVTPQDTTVIENMTIRNFGTGGIELPYGALPLRISNVKFLFNQYTGIDFKGLLQDYDHQAVHFDNISGDAQTEALIKLTNLSGTCGNILITNIKSECRINNTFGNVDGLQNVVKIVNPNTGARVSINGMTHISSISNGIGSWKKPADAIAISGGGVPHVEWNNASVRVRSGDTGTDPAMLSHSNYNISIPYTFASGRYSNIDRIDCSQGSNVQFLNGVIYNRLTQVGPATPAFVLSGTTPGYISYSPGADTDLKAGGIFFNTSGVPSFRVIKDDNSTLTYMSVSRSGSNLGTISFGTSINPTTDNIFSNGLPSNRWTIVYAATGTINTSDEREKVWRGSLEDAEIRAARKIIKLVGSYQWADSIAEKSPDKARIHYGVKAQDVVQVMVDEGLEEEPFENWRNTEIFAGAYPVGTELSIEEYQSRVITDAPEIPNFSHAFLCVDSWSDEWEPIEELRQIGTTEKTIDEEGNERDGEPIEDVIVIGYRCVRQAGSRYGLRESQLQWFIMGALL